MSVCIIRQEETHKNIKRILEIVTSLYGPDSKCILIENSSHYYSCTAVTSQDLFNAIQPDCNALKLMVTYVKNNYFVEKDGGLFTFILASYIILSLQDTSFYEYSKNKSVILDEVMNFLSKFKNRIDIGKLDHVRSIVKPVVQTKMTLKVFQLDHICVLFASVFASSIERNDIKVVKCSGTKIEDSKLIDGFLLPLEKYCHQSMFKDLGDLNLILIDVSISVDSEDLFGGSKETVLIRNRNETKKNTIEEILTKFCVKLAKYVDILICQKVVHPRMKRILKDYNVTCIDRIGLAALDSLKKEFNCGAVSCLTRDDFSDFITKVKGLKFISLHNKSYLKLTSDYSLTKTLVLCARNDRDLEVLGQCCEAIDTLLHNLSHDSSVIYGGGCTETMLAMHLRNFQPKENNNFILNLSFKKIMSCFFKVAMAVGDGVHFIDDKYHHHWISSSNTPSLLSSPSCCCGAVSNSSNLCYISFHEVLHSSNISKNAVAQELNIGNISHFVLHPLQTFKSNINAAFQLSDVISRIGLQVVAI